MIQTIMIVQMIIVVVQMIMVNGGGSGDNDGGSDDNDGLNDNGDVNKDFDNNESYTEDDDHGFNDDDVPIEQFTAPNFDDFDFESDDEYPNSNIEFNDSWILLWILKYQARFRLPDVAIHRFKDGVSVKYHIPDICMI